MIKDFFLSFKENIKQKTTNPFLGTLIIVWSFNNWKLLYAVFNFDQSYTLEKRLAFISEYLIQKPFLINLIGCVIYSVIVLIFTYAMINLSRLIVNFYEKKVTPLVYKITDKSSIVLKSEYEKLKSNNEHLDSKYNKERDLRLQIQDDRNKLEEQYGALLNENKKLLSENNTLDNFEVADQKTKDQKTKISPPIKIDEKVNSNDTQKVQDTSILQKNTNPTNINYQHLAKLMHNIFGDEIVEAFFYSIKNKIEIEESNPLVKFSMQNTLVISWMGKDLTHRIYDFTPIGQLVKDEYVRLYIPHLSHIF